MSNLFFVPARVILFLISDSFLVPAGIILILMVSITLVIRLLLKVKKDGWNWKNAGADGDAGVGTPFSSSPRSGLSFDDDIFKPIHTDPVYRNVPGNVYNWDS